jgi:hypothetical protein
VTAAAGGVNQKYLRYGLYSVWTGAVLGSASTLYSFAVKYGGWNRGWGLFLPASLDVYWITALAIAMDSSRDKHVRIKAAIHAAVAIAISISANILYHEMNAGDVRLDRAVRQLLVATGAAVPVLAGAALAHLTLLARAVAEKEIRNGTEEEAAAGSTKRRPPRQSGNGSKPRTGNDSTSGNGTAAGAETVTSTKPAQPETAVPPERPEPETTPTSARSAHGGSLAVVSGSPDTSSPDNDDSDAGAMTRAREIVKDDPRILYRRGGPTALGGLVDVTPRRGRQIAAALRAERAPEDAAGAN